MAETTGGNACPNCGVYMLPGAIHYCGAWPSPSNLPPSLFPTQVMLTPPQTGWTCPSCGRGNAPWVATCPHPLPATTTDCAVGTQEGNANG